jgi:hypothetical protein
MKEDVRIAIDTGYSFVKVKTGDKTFKFPTAIAVKGPTSTNFIKEERVYDFHDKLYRIGEDALHYDNRIYARDIEFIIKHSPLLVAHALELAGLKECPKELRVGLPIENFSSERKKFQQRLSKFVVSGKDYAFEKVVVIPQGIGALSDYFSEAKPSSTENGFLFDVGFNTVISLRYINMAAVQEGSRQYDQFGISRALESLATRIKNKSGMQFDLVGVNQVFQDKKIKGVAGAEIDVTGMISETMEEYLEMLMNRLRDDFGRHFDASDRLIISGGGAYYLKNSIPEKYKKIVYCPEEPEYANVRGYYYMEG